MDAGLDPSCGSQNPAPARRRRSFRPACDQSQVRYEGHRAGDIVARVLVDVFGRNSSSYRNYLPATSIDTAGVNMNGTPHHEVVQGLAHGKARSITLLTGAIRFFEEKNAGRLPWRTVRSSRAVGAYCYQVDQQY